MILFEKFASGRLVLPDKQIDFDSVEWSKHAKFEGVELKHIVTAQYTGGAFSYHLVRIAPGKKIGSHVHETQLETHEVIGGGGFCMREGKALVYGQGVISIIPAGIEHEVVAGDRGLYLFAKFMPALC
jgi:quercetin dioxygenase-like cupin family protein